MPFPRDEPFLVHESAIVPEESTLDPLYISSGVSNITHPLSNSSLVDGNRSPLHDPLRSPSSRYVNEGTKHGSDAVVSVSTTFYPGSTLVHLEPPDLVLSSSDSVIFYVHNWKLSAASNNAFNFVLINSGFPPPGVDTERVIAVSESSHVLNIVLHVVYGLSCAHYSPSFTILSSAVEALLTYGIPLQKVIFPQSPLFTTLLSHSATSALELYVLAASHDLSELAVSTSPHLLSLHLSELSVEMAQRMGSTYLRRLFLLHLERIAAFKRLIRAPPQSHALTQKCNVTEQKNLRREWALAASYLVWDVRPDISGELIESTLFSLRKNVPCGQCQSALQKRVTELVVDWSLVKGTI